MANCQYLTLPSQPGISTIIPWILRNTHLTCYNKTQSLRAMLLTATALIYDYDQIQTMHRVWLLTTKMGERAMQKASVPSH